MRKIWIVASREYSAAVRTKTFLIGLLIMPIMMGGSLLLQYLLKDVVDTETKHFVLIDRAGRADIVQAMEIAVKLYNEKTIDEETKTQNKPRFDLQVEKAGSGDAVAEQRLELSQRVRKGNLIGFLEILPPDHAGKDGKNAIVLRYQTNRPTYNDFAVLAEKVVGEYLRQRAVQETMIPKEQAVALMTPVALDQKGLTKRDADGKIEDESDLSKLGSVLMPIIMMMLMFMVVIMGATPLMQGVVEEKMQRIAEVLLGSVPPFELMLGKLIGMTGVSLTIASVYLGGGYWIAARFGAAEGITPDLIVWFVVFQTLASLMFGSLFIAIGAACTEMKETQNLVLPVMLLACVPMFMLGTVIREPNGPVVRGLSYFPFATPSLMMGRLSMPPGLPWWEPALGMAVVLVTTLICVYAAARIFRVGILLQGKGANFREILRWVVKG